MLTSVVLTLHIAFGCVGLVVGLVAMGARKQPGRHTRAGELYHWNMLCLCITAGTLAVLNWQRSWWFLPLAAFSYTFALLGYLAVKIRWPNWLRFHVVGQGGSYIAMTTALLVVNVGLHAWWAWATPTVVGSVIIAWLSREIALGRKPLLA